MEMAHGISDIKTNHFESLKPSISDPTTGKPSFRKEPSVESETKQESSEISQSYPDILKKMQSQIDHLQQKVEVQKENQKIHEATPEPIIVRPGEPSPIKAANNDTHYVKFGDLDNVFDKILTRYFNAPNNQP
eukprot:UN05531